jgi:hypothetical protein
MESLHRMGNVAEKACFGINKNKGMKFFLKVHLVLAISNKQIPPTKKDSQSDQLLLQATDEELVEELDNEDAYINVWEAVLNPYHIWYGMIWIEIFLLAWYGYGLKHFHSIF